MHNSTKKLIDSLTECDDCSSMFCKEHPAMTCPHCQARKDKWNSSKIIIMERGGYNTSEWQEEIDMSLLPKNERREVFEKIAEFAKKAIHEVTMDYLPF